MYSIIRKIIKSIGFLDITKINHESKDITNATVATFYKSYDNSDYDLEKENVEDEYRIYPGPKFQKDEPIKNHQNKSTNL